MQISAINCIFSLHIGDKIKHCSTIGCLYLSFVMVEMEKLKEHKFQKFITKFNLFINKTVVWKHKCSISVPHQYLSLNTGINPLNAELNPICYLLALLAHHFLHVSRIKVKSLTLRLLMSYIYIYIYIYIWSTYSWCF